MAIRVDLEAERKARYFQERLGGGAYWAMLLKAGFPRDEIKALIEFHVEGPSQQLVDFMGGQENIDALPGGWREPMLALSALRFVVEDLRVWAPQWVHAEPGERFERKKIREEIPIDEDDLADLGPVRYG